MSKSTKAASLVVAFTTTMWLSGAAYLAPAVAQAQTVEDLQAQISALLAQISSLQSQLTVLQGGSTSGFSHVFNVDLKMGSRGDEVKALQQALDLQGCFNYPEYTGYFGSITKSGAICFQDKYASEVLTPVGLSAGTGYVGPSTRTKLNTLYSTPVVTPPGGGDTTPPVVSGVFSVLGGDQPLATLAPQSAARLPFTVFKLSNGTNSDITVDSITVERSGLAQDAAFAGVVLLDETGAQITNTAKTLNSTHQAILSDDFVVPAGTTKIYTLAGNMAAALTNYAGQVAYLSLVNVNAVGLTASGTLPITGAGHTINSTLGLGSATLTVGSNDPGTAATKEIGTKGYKFGALKITAGSSENLTVKRLRLNQSGSAGKDDIANVVVVDSKTAKEYPTTVSSDGKYFTSVFDSGLVVKKGENQELYWKADIVDGSNRNIDFDLWKYEDLVISGNTYGYNVTPSATEANATDNDAADFNSSNPRWSGYVVTIGAGSFRAEKSNVVPSQNVVTGGTQVPLGAFLFEVKGEPITFASWKLDVVTTTGSTSATSKTLLNVTAYDENGQAVAGPVDTSIEASATAGTQDIAFTDSVTVPVGTHVYTIKGNINTAWTNNDTIQLRFDPDDEITSITGDVSGTTITPSPTSDISGNIVTVKTGGLTVTPAGSLASQSIVRGGNNVELGRFILDASASGEDLRATIAKFRMTPASSLNNNQITSLVLKDGDTALNTGTNVVDPASSTSAATQTLTLDNNLIIPKGATKVVSLYGNVTATAQSDGTVKFDFSGLTDGDWTVTGVDTTTEITEDLDTSTAGATFTMKTAGGVKIALDSSSPSEKWYSAGSSGVHLSTLRFTATTEQFAVKNLRLTLKNTASSSAYDITKLYLYDENDNLIASKTSPAFSSNQEDFTLPISGAGSFVVLKDSNKKLKVKADLAGIGANLPGVSGHLVAVDWGAGALHRTGSKAVGASSGSTINIASGVSDALGTTSSSGVRYFRSVPTVEKLNVTGGLVSGAVLYKFKITADAAYDVAVQKFTFTLSTSGGSALVVDNFILKDITDGLDVTDQHSIKASTAAFNSSGDVVMDVPVDTTNYSAGYITIPAGTSHTFDLVANSVTLTSTTGESATTRLEGDAKYPADSAALAGLTKAEFMWPRNHVDLDTNDDFIWTDFSSDATTTHSFGTSDWINGYKVSGLPTSNLASQTITE